jgi:hypothetical protein
VRKGFPTDRPLLGGDITQGLLPVDFRKGNRGRLDRALDQEACSITTLSCTGYFSSMPEEIIAFGADKALARSFATGGGGEGCIDVELAEGVADPGMNAFVTLRRTKRIPGVHGREAEGIRPVSVVRNQSAPGGASDEGSEPGETFHILQALEITERGGWLGPAIEPEDWTGAFNGGFEEGEIERHVEEGIAGTGVNQEPGFLVGCSGRVKHGNRNCDQAEVRALQDTGGILVFDSLPDFRRFAQYGLRRSVSTPARRVRVPVPRHWLR